MVKTLIIDDEQHCIDRVTELIDPYKLKYMVVDTVKTVQEALLATHNYSPDLVFLDVQIANKTGFDYLKKLDRIDFNIIFTTAYEKYAIEAIKFSALDYLLKPIGQEAFDLAIKKYENNFSLNEINKKLDSLLFNLKEKSLNKLCIPSFDGIDFVELDNILFLEADINYTTIVLKNNEKMVVSKTLKNYENLLRNSGFFRVHNSFLVNLNYVKKYTKGKGGYVTMVNDKIINVSYRRKDKFLKTMQKI